TQTIQPECTDQRKQFTSENFETERHRPVSALFDGASRRAPRQGFCGTLVGLLLRVESSWTSEISLSPSTLATTPLKRAGIDGSATSPNFRFGPTTIRV